MKEYPRKVRVGMQLQRELVDLIRELTDPRVQMVSVTNVDASPDMRNATVLVSNFGDDASLDSAVTALNGAAGKLRHGLGQRLKLRSVPILHFKADKQLREADRLAGLIREAVRADRENAEPGPKADD